jgi:DeoR family glycerol-3-phosphate regulon repressor
MKERTAAKQAIAVAVADYVADGMTVLIDSGSTTAFVARALLRKRDLTIVTNALEIAHTLVGRCDHQVYLAGGSIRADVAASVGPEAHQLVGEFRADLAILSIGSVDAVDGYKDFDVDEARIARAMIERSNTVVVAADAYKYTAKAPVCICGFEPVGVFVSDSAPPPALADRLRAAATEVRLATIP